MTDEELLEGLRRLFSPHGAAADPVGVLADKLGVSRGSIAVVESKVQQPVAVSALAGLISDNPGLRWVGVEKENAVWRSFELGAGWSVTVPIDAAAHLTLEGGVPAVLWVEESWDAIKLSVGTAPGCAEAAARFLHVLTAEASGPRNIWRFKRLVAEESGDAGIVNLSPDKTPLTSPDDVVVPKEVWESLETNIHRFLDRCDALLRAGLGGSRGILVSGLPGTGKTVLIQAALSKLAGEATILRASPPVIHRHLGSLYDIAGSLTPAVVVLEDVDFAFKSRMLGGGDALMDFLSATDRAAGAGGLVTIVSTNHPEVLDEAAVRSARVDVHIRVPLPDQAARKRLYRMFIDRLPDGTRPEIDDSVLDRLASESEGVTGADIMERVRMAVLRSPDGRIRVEDLRLPGSQERADASGGVYL